MGLTADVQGAVDSYIGAVDTALPGFIEGLYVTGSIPLGDYRPAISDIDMVAVCAQRPARQQLEALGSLHRPSRPSIDVLYVTSRDLACDPGTLSPPYALEGAFRAEGGGYANPVTWRQLATAAIAIRGPSLTDADVWFDPSALRRWNLANLDDYWLRWLEGWRRVEPAEARLRHAYGLQHLVLGIPRLHHTIATLGITSKTGAGRYALGVADRRWHAVIEVAMAVRADQSAPLSGSVEALHRDGGDLSMWLIEDAHRLVEG